MMFQDKSGYLVQNVSPSDLWYAKRHDGYFFDCHEIRDFLSSRNRSLELSLDIGANLGSVTYLLAKTSRRVISFEPNPETVEQLRLNMTLNQISNVEVEQLACSEVSRPLSMYQNDYHGHSSLTKKGKFQKPFEVHAIRLDEYLESREIKSIDFLKIDVEGHEFSVLKGLGRFLNPEYCKAIVWEHSLISDPTGSTSTKVYQLLISSGYSIRDFQGNQLSIESVVERSHMDVLAI
jgi:FkbM family methyltransferase